MNVFNPFATALDDRPILAHTYYVYINMFGAGNMAEEPLENKILLISI